MTTGSFFEKYTALERLQTIVVESPGKADLLEILKGLRGRFRTRPPRSNH